MKIINRLHDWLAGPQLFNALNAFFFYAGWWLLVLTIQYQLCLTGLAIIFVILAIHFWLSHTKQQELILLPFVALVGFIVDSIYKHIGVISYSCDSYSASWSAPPWVAGIYLLLGSSIYHSFSLLQKRPLSQIIMGAWGAPISYYAGSRLNAIHFLWPTHSALLLLAVVWSLFLPFCFLLSDWIDRYLQK